MSAILSILPKCVDASGGGIIARVHSNKAGWIATDGKILLMVGNPFVEEDGRRLELYDEKGTCDHRRYPTIPETLWIDSGKSVSRLDLENLVDDSNRRYEEQLAKWSEWRDNYDKATKWHGLQTKQIKAVYKTTLADIDRMSGPSLKEKRNLKREARRDRDAKLKHNEANKPRREWTDKPLKGGLGVTTSKDAGIRLAFAGRYVSLMLKAFNIKGRGPAKLYLAHRGALCLTFDTVRMLIMPISLPE